MGRQEIDYLELKDKIIKFLEERRAIVLDTSADNRVTARTVSFVSEELQIFFWSYRNHTKFYQIQENPKVALSRDNLQIEGISELKGSVLDPENEDYLEKYRKKFPQEYERYVDEPDMILVTVKPTLFVLMVNIDGTLYRDHLDVRIKDAYRIETRE
ncbi:MAG: pyridoxamine 5'-phosphate oxidase family protein [Candidatus Hodarchaeota archaeon]